MGAGGAGGTPLAGGESDATGSAAIALKSVSVELRAAGKGLDCDHQHP